jgi:small subunit ribosomal protein S17
MAMLLGTSTFHGAAIAARPAAAVQRGSTSFIPIRAAQSLQGRVVSLNTKTAVVAVETLVVHPVYNKRVKRTDKYTAHDEEEKCKEGDLVVLSPSRPLSKKKRFTVSAVLQSAK